MNFTYFTVKFQECHHTTVKAPSRTYLIVHRYYTILYVCTAVGYVQLC